MYFNGTKVFNIVKGINIPGVSNVSFNENTQVLSWTAPDLTKLSNYNPSVSKYAVTINNTVVETTNTSIYVGEYLINGSNTMTVKAFISFNKESDAITEDIELTYVFVDYIESTGNQYIDTQYSPTNNNTVEIDSQYTSTYTMFNCDWGIDINTSTGYTRFMGMLYRGSSTSLGVFDALESASNVDPSSRNLYKYEINFSNKTYSFYQNNVLKNTYTKTSISSRPITTTFIFCCNDNASNQPLSITYSTMKLYSFKIYSEGVLVRDFKPCYRSTDKVVGLLDIVNNVFYVSPNGIPFLIGTTHDDLMFTINNLPTISTTKTLILGSTNLAKLSEEEKAIATNKGWTLA